MSTIPTVRCLVNLSFDGYKRGEIVDADPVLCARYFENGWLTECDDEGRRIIPLLPTDTWIDTRYSVTRIMRGAEPIALLDISTEYDADVDAPG